MTNQQKTEILELIESEKQRLGSYRAVANKCKVSEATISQLRKGTYAAEGDDIYETIALALHYEFDDGLWNVAEITNFRIVTEVLQDAKSECMFMGISHRAGSGKTCAANVFLKENKRSVFKVDCEEWSARVLLLKIAYEIGAEIPKGYASVSVLIERISETIKKIARLRPLLIIDQANSLRPSALRIFIHLFNRCEDILGVVILGSESLEHEIKKGVRLNWTGYDELDSRFGRKYIRLIGSNLADTRKICDANGIADKEMQKRIFDKCEPSKIALSDGRRVDVIEDMRRLKRVIKSERIKMKHYGN